MDKEDQTEKMNEPGYKKLLTYKLAQIAFDLGWDFVPQYYNRPEDRRQRDQIYQALRSHKQNIVEGSAERSLSTKLKLYDVAKSSGMESKEDFEDILRMERFPLWNKTDPRLLKLRKVFENYPPSPSYPSTPPFSSVSSVLEPGEISGTRGIRRGEKQIEVDNKWIHDGLELNEQQLLQQAKENEKLMKQQNDKLLANFLSIIRR